MTTYSLIADAVRATKALADITEEQPYVLGVRRVPVYGTAALDEACALVIRRAAMDAQVAGAPDDRYAPENMTARLGAVIADLSGARLHRPPEQAKIIAEFAEAAFGADWTGIRAALGGTQLDADATTARWALIDSILDTGSIYGAVSPEAAL